MNYFEFFDIPVGLQIDENLLKEKYYTNSKKFHPDFFTLDSVDKQMEALELSTLNNNAYKTLINFDKRLQHILSLNDALGEEGQQKIPQSFLLEMMEINEALMELEFDFQEERYNRTIEEIKAFQERLKAEILPVLPKKGNEISEEDLRIMKNYYLKHKYLHRLEENIQKLKAR